MNCNSLGGGRNKGRGRLAIAFEMLLAHECGDVGFWAKHVLLLPIAWVLACGFGGACALRYTSHVFIADAKKVLA